MYSKFSFIIPTYNNSEVCIRNVRCLIQALGSRSDYEILVVNDGGEFSDESKKELNQFALVNFHCKVNGGVSSARNFGIQKSVGEYVVFIDDDDYYDNNLVNYLDCIDNCDAAYCGFSKILDGKKTVITTEFTENQVQEKYLSGQIYTHLSCWVLKKSIIVDNNLVFDENLAYSEDVLFVSKFLEFAKKITYYNHYIFNYICNSKTDNLSKYKFSNIAYDVKACQEIISFTRKKSVKDIVQYYRLPVLLLRYLNSDIPEKDKQEIKRKFTSLYKLPYYKSKVNFSKLIKIYILRGKVRW